MEINKYNGTHLIYKRTVTPKYIAIHYTAGFSSSKGTAKNTCAWFADSTAKGSAHYAVDDVEIWQYADPSKYYCASVGGNPNDYTCQNSLAKTLYGKCTNKNSISIEICSCNSVKSYSALDTYYLTDKALENAAQLVRYLMGVYSIDIDHVVCHNFVTGKPCPAPWVRSEGQLSGWYDFKERILDDMTEAKVKEIVAAEITPLTTAVNNLTAALEKISANTEAISAVKTAVANLTEITGTGDACSKWATPYVEWAEANGIFSGDGGDYGWTKPITREQVAVLEYNRAKAGGEEPTEQAERE